MKTPIQRKFPNATKFIVTKKGCGMFKVGTLLDLYRDDHTGTPRFIDPITGVTGFKELRDIEAYEEIKTADIVDVRFTPGSDWTKGQHRFLGDFSNITDRDQSIHPFKVMRLNYGACRSVREVRLHVPEPAVVLTVGDKQVALSDETIESIRNLIK